jgi:hypothetical protein
MPLPVMSAWFFILWQPIEVLDVGGLGAAFGTGQKNIKVGNKHLSTRSL